MKIELHILQNFAPSNLNRDDTGAPKDCELGGHRRARISSQCQKRAVRERFRLEGMLAKDELGARTKRLVHEVATELVEKHDWKLGAAADLTIGAIEGVGLGRNKNKRATGEDLWKTEYLLFVPRRVVSELASIIYEHRDKLTATAVTTRLDRADAELADEDFKGAEQTLCALPDDDELPEELRERARELRKILDDKKGATTENEEANEAAANKAKKKVKKKAKKRTKKKVKKEAKDAYPKEIREQVQSLLESTRSTADIALFGRMIADAAGWNVEASCQVAHAISTNRVQMDFDFFTAIDDFKPDDTAGSDMMGTVQFNSSCFYRYAVLDVEALRDNLDVGGAAGDALLRKSVDAFVRAFVSAIPTGKQNSMAAHNFPSYILGVARDGGQPISLSNAFLKPARPHHQKGTGNEIDLVDDSITKLEDYFGRMSDALGGSNLLKITWADRDLEAKNGVIRAEAKNGTNALDVFFADLTNHAVPAKS